MQPSPCGRSSRDGRAPLSALAMYTATLMLLGSGELGREFAIAAKRLGCRVIACDRYANAPAMQVADDSEVFAMLDGKALKAAVKKHKPDVIIPEIEAIDTAALADLEKSGLPRRAVGQGGAADHEPRRHPRLRGDASWPSSPPNIASPKAARRRSRRSSTSACRASSSRSCPLRARARAPPRPSRRSAKRGTMPSPTCAATGRASSSRNLSNSTARSPCSPSRPRTGSCSARPSATARKPGDYRESWQPAAIPDGALLSARHQARRVVDALGGHGIFGVEFFVVGEKAIFSELSPRPHDTGMVTLISQFPNEFELHLRAILGLPIPGIEFVGPSASAVILAEARNRTTSPTRDWPRRSRSARPGCRSTCASSPSPRRSRTAAWRSPWRAPTRSTTPWHGRSPPRLGLKIRSLTRCSRQGGSMMRYWKTAFRRSACAALAGCGDGGAPANQQTAIKVRGPGAGPAPPARRLQSRDRAQAGDLRCRLHLPSG